MRPRRVATRASRTTGICRERSTRSSPRSARSNIRRRSTCAARLRLYDAMALPRDNAAEHAAKELERLLSGYRPLPGIFDEMMDPGGGPRADWQPCPATVGG